MKTIISQNIPPSPNEDTPMYSQNEESSADLGYIKLYAKELKKRIGSDGDNGVLQVYLSQIFDLADKVYQRHFRQ